MTPALSALTLSANNRRIRWAGILLLATILMLGLGLFFTGSERTPETAAVHKITWVKRADVCFSGCNPSEELPAQFGFEAEEITDGVVLGHLGAVDGAPRCHITVVVAIQCPLN